ncbi:MAG: hypothetical protein WA191_12190 [Telluria sp.]|nr:hypothetical protein [Telluria sp.]
MSSQLDAISYAYQLEAEIAVCEARVISRIELAEARLLSRIEAGEARILSRIEAGEARLFSRIESGEAKLWGEITLLKWMTGTSIALNIAVLLKLFIP